MIIKVDIGEIEDIDVKKELSISGKIIFDLMYNKKGDPIDNLKDLAMHSLRTIELYKKFENS